VARVRGFLSARAGVCRGLCMHGGAGAVHPRAGGRGGCASIHKRGRACTPTYVRASPFAAQLHSNLSFPPLYHPSTAGGLQGP
jgi:hypothetical protein